MLKCLYCLFARETANVSHLMFTNNNCTRLCLKGMMYFMFLFIRQKISQTHDNHEKIP